MRTPELEVSARTRSIITHSGGEVVLCINGMEAQHLTITYNINYGKKSERGEINVNKNIDSAIMKMH